MTERTKPRLLIFIVAYFAQSTLEKVLERIPRALFDEVDCEVLVVDDASTDRTFDIGDQYRQAHSELPLTVLRNEFNQGYGGNQKVGYTYAIANGFDFVALVHGDGQYAPEALPSLLAPLLSGTADAVFGSRMLSPMGALRGGMPLYKFAGNRILTRIQNTLLRARMSEFHSGYRVYSVRALSEIRFQLNTNDFHFDTEIIIELLNAGARIVELPIPTYYGEEICRVNGLKYAKDVVRVTLQNVGHRMGVRYQRRFEPQTPGNAGYGLKLGYPSSHQYALDAVPKGVRVIDIGSGPGQFAAHLLDKGCDVTVVDKHPIAESHDRLHSIVQDLDEGPKFEVAKHEVLLMLDIIEHLKEPEQFMAKLRQQFDYDNKTLILTTPNIAFFVQRLMLLLGEFNYGRAGILDRTHTRLFTFRTLRQLLQDEGFRIKEVRGVPAPFPKVLGDGPLGKVAVAANLALIRLNKQLFSYQIYVEAETTPAAEFVLAHSAKTAGARSRQQGDSTGPDGQSKGR